MRSIMVLVCVFATVVPDMQAAEAIRKPNVVIILADDLGYGDVGCNNPDRGKIATPNIDRLAKDGMRFTDAHSSSGVCSPTRYSLLTGRYHWRTRLQQGIVGVWGAPLIAADRMTIASVTKQQGYHTACVGKWHLGWDWPIPASEMKHFRGLGGQGGGGGKVETEPTAELIALSKQVFSQSIPGGPTTRGFDEYFGTDVPNWPPYCFIENDRSVGIPSTLMPAPQFVKNQASLQGPALPGWKLEPILPSIAERACEVISKQAAVKKPFLLYLPLTAPHTPIAVAKDWQGKSPLGHPYADFVMQTDAVVGQVLDSLTKAGIADDTLVVFTSDNGCASYIGVKDLEAKGHHPSGPLRGYKADAWEGGHRIPFVVRWPGKVKPDSTCSQTICSVDLMATVAEVLGVTLPATAGEDSVSLMPLLRGDVKPIHDGVVHHSSTGVFAIRSGKWKLILGPGSGPSNGTQPHLYDIAADLGETKDLAAVHPDQVNRLTQLLEKFVADGRSTPGEKQNNDVAVQILKKPKAKTPPSKTGTTAKPNIVFILADDLGREDCGFMGGKTIKTPHLDKLATAGTKLDAFYVQPVCSPTRAAMMTGRYPMRHGLQVGVVRPWAQYGLPLDERTLPQALKDAGYATAITGKWHLGHSAPEYLPTRRGFDYQYGHYNGQIDYFTHVRDGGFDWHKQDQACRDEGYSTHLIAKAAVNFVAETAGKKPFFLYVPFNAVHSPHQAPDEYMKPYANLKGERHKYAGMLAAMDEAVGQIVDAVDKAGERNNTLFIFSSDNGGPQPGKVTDNGQYRAGKGTLYEGGVRVAAFANWDGHIKPGSTVTAPLHMVDWYPTLLKLCGANPVQKLPVDGLDIWPVLTQGQASPHDAILINTTPVTGAVRVGDWKLVTKHGTDDPDGAPAKKDAKASVELFNLKVDPFEKTNLSEQHPERVKSLQSTLAGFAKQAVAPKASPKPKGFESPKVWGEPNESK